MASSTGIYGRKCADPQQHSCGLCDVRPSSICADLSDAEMARIEQIMARRRIAKGRAILAEGEPNDCLYVVVEGSFRLSKYLEDGRRQVTGFLFKGDFCGVRPSAASAYTAEALEDSLVCQFPHGRLEQFAQNAPSVKDRLIARGQTEYHKAQDHIVLLGKKTAEERVESFLGQIAGAVGETLEDGRRSAPLPMSRQDIADYLGLRLETLSRTLAALKKKGVVEDITRRAVVLA